MRPRHDTQGTPQGARRLHGAGRSGQRHGVVEQAVGQADPEPGAAGQDGHRNDASRRTREQQALDFLRSEGGAKLSAVSAALRLNPRYVYNILLTAVRAGKAHTTGPRQRYTYHEGPGGARPARNPKTREQQVVDYLASSGGATFAEAFRATGISRVHLENLLRRARVKGLVYVRGEPRAFTYFAGPEPPSGLAAWLVPQQTNKLE